VLESIRQLCYLTVNMDEFAQGFFCAIIVVCFIIVLVVTHIFEKRWNIFGLAPRTLSSIQATEETLPKEDKIISTMGISQEVTTAPQGFDANLGEALERHKATSSVVNRRTREDVDYTTPKVQDLLHGQVEGQPSLPKTVTIKSMMDELFSGHVNTDMANGSTIDSSDVGLSSGSQGVVPTTHVSQENGGYRSLSAFNRHTSSKNNGTRSFAYLVGRRYHDATKELVSKNKNLHVLYIGFTKFKPLEVEDSNVIGVRIRDTEFNKVTDDINTYRPSDIAIITEIIDIGGVDKNGLGEIKI